MPPRTRQFTIRELLVVTFGASVLFAILRAVGRGVGMWELILLALAAGSLGLAALMRNRPWLWAIGAAVWFPIIWALVPLAPLEKTLWAAAFCCYYAVAGLPLLIVRRAGSRTWPWALGSLPCVLLAVFVTPADPVSALIAAVPLCGAYCGLAFFWTRRQVLNRAAAEGD